MAEHKYDLPPYGPCTCPPFDGAYVRTHEFGCPSLRRQSELSESVCVTCGEDGHYHRYARSLEAKNNQLRGQRASLTEERQRLAVENHDLRARVAELEAERERTIQQLREMATDPDGMAPFMEYIGCAAAWPAFVEPYR